MTLYADEESRFYTDHDVWERLEDGRWAVRLYDTEAGWELVETRTGDLRLLVPVDPGAMPDDRDVERRDGRPTVVERERS